MAKGKIHRLDFYNINADGIGSIGVYYSHKKKIKRFPTYIKCHKKYWDKKNKSIIKGGIDDYERTVVNNLYQQIDNIISRFRIEYPNSRPSIEEIESQLRKPDNLTRNIHELYKEFLEYKEKTEPKTYKLYKETGRYLKETDRRNKYSLNLTNFNFGFIEKFKDYLKNVRGNQNSTVNSRIEKLNHFVTWINKKEIPNNIKTKNWEKEQNNSVEDFTCLERNELKAIKEYQPSKKDKLKVQWREERTQDIIIFLAQTGMRVGDIKHISKANIVNGNLEFIPEKTKRKKIKAIVPITKSVNAILKKYNYKVPVYGEKSMNKNIRLLCDKIPELKVKIWHTTLVNNEPVTELKRKCDVLDSHGIGRKTFINICIEKKIQLTSIMGMTGHTSIDTILKHYADKHKTNEATLSDAFDE